MKTQHINKFIKNLIFIVIITFTFSCNSKNLVFSKISYEDVKNIEIKKSLYDSNCVKLSPTDIKKFTELINSKNKIIMLKTKPEYWLFVHFQNDSTKLYKLKENNLVGEFDIYKEFDSKYFINIYKNSKKNNCK